MRWIIPVMLVLVVVALGAVGYGHWTAGEIVTQPIAFNHNLHLTEAGMDCLNCHTDAKAARFAGLPGKDACFDCHDPDDMADEGDDLHPEKAKLMPFADSDDDIPWGRVARTAPHVYFSHRRHVTSAGMDCLECHVDQKQLTTPPARSRLVMAMTDCIDCHEQKGASTDCLACHR